MEVVLLRRKVDMMGKTFSGSFVRDSQGGGGWGGVLWEFLGGDVPLGPWNP